MPPKELTEMVASPEPQTAVMRRRRYGTTTGVFSILIGPTTGPVFGGLSFGAGGLGLVSGVLLDGAAGGATGAGGSGRYFKAKSEIMRRFSETFAFN